jgi:glutamine amidotransferase
MIVIVDYGMGNLGSILNMLRKIGAEAKLSSAPADIEQADKLILPGVGSFDSGAKNLHAFGLVPVLSTKVLDKKTPILGICLGMQLFTRKSEEGQLPGLGWIDAETVRFRIENRPEKLKVPHMGWNTVQIKREAGLFDHMFPDPRFYFVHSYHLVCHNEDDILSTTFYGYEFASSFGNANILGVQFHPEKSHKFGMKLLKNFVELA